MSDRSGSVSASAVGASLSRNRRFGVSPVWLVPLLAAVNRCDQTQNLAPMSADVLDVQRAADPWLQSRVVLDTLRDIQLGLA